MRFCVCASLCTKKQCFALVLVLTSVSVYPWLISLQKHSLQKPAAGCIPNDYYDMGVAVGPLNVPANVYYPVKLQITGWSDGTRVSYTNGTNGS